MPTSINAQAGYYLHEQVADVTVSFLSFPSGAKAHLFVSWLHPYKEQKLVVIGDRKMAVFDDVEPQDKLLLFPHSIDWHKNMPVPRKAEATSIPVESIEPLLAECQHFLDCIATRTAPSTDGSEGLRVLTVLEQCHQALERERGQPSNGINGKTSAFFAHESAFIDDEVEIGEGTTIWHVSHIMKNSRIGRNCRIGQNVVVGPNVTIGSNVKIQNNVCVYEGVTLEDNVFCGPSMVFTNVFNPRSEIARMDELRQTLVRDGATLGSNSTIICGTTIGRYAFVAAGAVVTKDVPDYALVMGNPARIKGWMCRCGVQLEFIDCYAHCSKCGTRYVNRESEIERLVDSNGAVNRT
jgi:UDP-2-acetamido-3-amino-2,3-dideoxy-glucuronate N-acetyltransferase